jgi:hypothetical protein
MIDCNALGVASRTHRVEYLAAQVSDVPSIVELMPSEQGGGIGRAVLTEAEHRIRDEPVS